MFIFRNIGNIVNNKEANKAIKYALQKLNIPDIVICGHSECGAMNDDDDLSKQNVIKQLENLKTYPIVQDRINSGTLSISGLWFDISTARVYQYDANSNIFVLIE